MIHSIISYHIISFIHSFHFIPSFHLCTCPQDHDKLLRLYIEQQRRLLAEEAGLPSHVRAARQKAREADPTAGGTLLPPPRPLLFGRGRPKKIQLVQVGGVCGVGGGWVAPGAVPSVQS